MVVDDVKEISKSPSLRVWQVIEEFRYSQCGEEPLEGLKEQNDRTLLTFCTLGSWVENGFHQERREASFTVVQVREFVVA